MALTIESLLPKEKAKTPAHFAHPPQSGQASHSDMGKGKRKWDEGGNYGYREKPWTGGQGGNYNQQQQAQQKRPCPRCNKVHLGECLKGVNVCFNCGEQGHYANTCPKRNRGAPQRYNPGYQQRDFGNPPRNQGNPPRNPGNQPRQNQGPGGNQRPPQYARAYALNQQQAAQGQGNLAGMISVLGTPIIALFDTRASHYFISHDACKMLNLIPELTQESLEISTPGGGRMTTKHTISNLELNIGADTLKADLYVISMIEFDIILGIDWLTKTSATICCNERRISFFGTEPSIGDVHNVLHIL